MKLGSFIIAGCILLCVSHVLAAKGPCSQLTLPSNLKEKYDLSPIMGKSFTAAYSDGSTTFTWAICGTVDCNGAPNAAVCQAGQITVVGADWNPNQIVTVAPPNPPAKGIGIQYTNTFARLIDAIVYCDKKAKEPHTFVATRPIDMNSPTILSFYHQSGCPKKGGLSGGSICLIILTVCLVLYFVLGFLWKRFRQGKEGADAIPNFLWKDLPGLVKDGFMFLIGKCRGTSNYETVA